MTQPYGSSRSTTFASRPWSEPERTYLRNAAGKQPLADIARALERDTASVERAALELSLPLEQPTVKLVWCDRCATWRTSVSKSTGWCRVCTMREQLVRREEACADALATMKPCERAIYEKTEAERATKRLPPYPCKKYVPASQQSERSAEDARYLEAIETWECRVLKLRYDAAKTRLRRMREKTGTNPRKKNRPE